VVYRRTRTEMPAIAEEIEEALAEGVRIEQLEAPLRLEGDGDATALVCRRMTLGEPDESGRARPVPVDGDEALTAFRCDTVLLALGQAPDSSLLPAGPRPDDEGCFLEATTHRCAPPATWSDPTARWRRPSAAGAGRQGASTPP